MSYSLQGGYMWACWVHETAKYPHNAEGSFQRGDCALDEFVKRADGNLELTRVSSVVAENPNESWLAMGKRNMQSQMPEFSSPVANKGGAKPSAAMGTFKGVPVHLFLGRNLRICAAGNDNDELASVITELASFAPPFAPKDQRLVPWSFWHHGSRGGGEMSARDLYAGKWPEIEANYTARTRTAVDSLMALQPADVGGRLILWHGSPGTGKTTAIRALAQEWRGWCQPHYIIDPDAFFHNADYMLQVLMEGSESAEDDLDDAEYLSLYGHPKPEGKWNLLIIEDAEELLREDAKEKTGQALSRLLNVGDGLIGQGLNVLFLITTNEDLDKIHPAIQRKGRCLANVEFERFADMDARRWLEDHGLALAEQPAIEGRQSLADLYERLHVARQVVSVAERKPMGLVR